MESEDLFHKTNRLGYETTMSQILTYGADIGIEQQGGRVADTSSWMVLPLSLAPPH